MQINRERGIEVPERGKRGWIIEKLVNEGTAATFRLSAVRLFYYCASNYLIESPSRTIFQHVTSIVHSFDKVSELNEVELWRFRKSSEIFVDCAVSSRFEFMHSVKGKKKKKGSWELSIWKSSRSWWISFSVFRLVSSLTQGKLKCFRPSGYIRERENRRNISCCSWQLIRSLL